MHLEWGPKIGPPLAECEEESFSHSQPMARFSEAPAGSPLRRAQRPCYGNRPVPVTELGPVPVTLHCYRQSVPVTSNPRCSLGALVAAGFVPLPFASFPTIQPYLLSTPQDPAHDARLDRDMTRQKVSLTKNHLCSFLLRVWEAWPDLAGAGLAEKEPRVKYVSNRSSHINMNNQVPRCLSYKLCRAT